MLKRRWAIVLAGFALAGSWCVAAESPAFSDSPYVIKTWKSGPGDQSLPQSVVIAIAQSKSGYLWLGTLNGLARFDGIRFTVFDEAKVPGLNSRRIVSLFEDSHTNLWVGTQADGVAVIRKDGSIENLRVGRGEAVVSIAEDAAGAIWLNTASGEVSRWRNQQLQVIPYRALPIAVEKPGPVWLGMGQRIVGLTASTDLPEFPVEQDLPVGKVDFLLAGKKAGVWRLADNRIQKWTGNRLEHDWAGYPWGAARVTTACEDEDGNLIVGTYESGVFWFDAEGKATRIDSAQGLSHNTALSLCLDAEGNLWVGTDGGGLNRVKKKFFRVVQGSAGRTIQSVCPDHEGGNWFANFGGKLSHWKNGALEQFGAEQGLLDPYMNCVLADHQGAVWVGMRLGGLFRRPAGAEAFERINRREVNNPISALYEDRSQRLWIGTRQGLVSFDGQNWRSWTERDGLSTNDVRALSEDANGTLWIGTERGGLNSLRDGKFAIYRKSERGLPSDNVSALWADADGVLWIGTGAGLARLQNGNWSRYTTREGLANNGIGCLLDDAHGDLWIGSYVGLMRLSKKSLNDCALERTNSIVCRVYEEADGLPTPECAQGSQPAACRTEDGRLWFATIQGLVSVNPAGLTPNLFRPPVIIEQVLVDGQPQNTNSLRTEALPTIVIPPGYEHLEIQFTSLNLGAANRSRFRYWLEGHEKIPNEVGDVREARYPRLPPNHYRFHVTACNEDGLWNPVDTTQELIVLPPFWQKPWFLAVSAACLLGVIVAIVYYLSTQKLHRQLTLMRQQEALEKERGRIARDLHDQLGANLTQVALLGELAHEDKNLPDEIESHAKQISQTARETTRALDEIVWAVNPSNDTLEGLITYVCRYAQEYFALANLKYRMDVPTELPATSVPPEVRHNVFLAAKEAINNVVKHAQASFAWFRLRMEPDRFTLEIEDDGRGLAELNEKSGRNGLLNMRKRMEDIGGSFSISPGPGKGAVVRLTVPIGK